MRGLVDASAMSQQVARGNRCDDDDVSGSDAYAEQLSWLYIITGCGSS